ncbi:nucleoside diphosphate kinase regulator [Altererythrobacter xixiisoli]|uniref:Nucleoside diphosphate kinase regulator n=1 Tax=Croceibacterium xixiisoli TaxID=1476466 RepID=A0A6I4TQW2_9SPHN|nr:nucleoside diphosphate kinase regulator [Croceibacterium xixiisoli]MXO98286.1 nucleoside diphosphate kinase regulator [Croceibacterium xixiisoli]
MAATQLTERPPIVLIESEADALSDLAFSIRSRNPTVANLLIEEIDRAETVDAAQIPADVVTMGSTVTFVDQKSGEQHRVQLVFPGDADLDAGRLSILTPVGAGLIGLRAGQSISWPDRTGKDRTLTIEQVIRG